MSFWPKAVAITKPLLLTQDINFTRSVIHACAQNSLRAINEALGVDDVTLADEYMQTPDGKALMRGLKGYALFSLGKTIMKDDP